jgi:tRNA (guanine-N7-)-methyltransferase
VAFIREQIDHLENYFEEGEIDEIWITFPDPFLKNSRSRKRLTSEKFLPIYKKILKPGGLIHLKTDSTPLYLFTKEVIESTGAKLLIDSPNVYEDGTQEKLLMGIQTYYEKMHIADGRTIQYLCFRL